MKKGLITLNYSYDHCFVNILIMFNRGRGGCSQGFGIAPSVLEYSQGLGVKCENLSDLL